MEGSERWSCCFLLAFRQYPCLAIAWIGLFIAASQARSAYVSEIDFGGPGRQGIELSQVDPTQDYTLLFMSASPTSSFLFGMVLDVLHVPAGAGRAGVAMVTDGVWSSDPALTTPLDTLPLASGNVALPLIDHLLLVVMQGRSNLERFNNPLSQGLAKARYDTTLMTDWLVLSRGDQVSAYGKAHDVDRINAELGIDLFARLVDKGAGRIIGRTHQSGQAIDMDTFYVGQPDPVSKQFDVDESLAYTYTPGFAGLPLVRHSPEPSTLVMLSLSLGLVCRRRSR